MENNLFVIGDSFCRDSFYVKPTLNQNKCFWDVKSKQMFLGI